MTKEYVSSKRDAIGLANNLLTSLREHQKGTFSRFAEPTRNGKTNSLYPFPVEQLVGCRNICKIVSTLDHVLKAEHSDPIPKENRNTKYEDWTLGTVNATYPIRSKYGGCIEPVLCQPIVRRVPDVVVSFLLVIPEWKDFLKREQHSHFGWHYHYLNSRKDRSDIVLCWDTRKKYQGHVAHPLFWEFHAEGRADFFARPDRWEYTKRQSMHSVCAKDLEEWSLDKFRCASNGAEPVWPISAKLSKREGVAVQRWT